MRELMKLLDAEFIYMSLYTSYFLGSNLLNIQ